LFLRLYCFKRYCR